MALKVRINPVEKVTTASILGRSLAERKKVAADYVRTDLEEAKRTNASIIGHVPKYTTTVDGRANAPLESVNPDGGSIIVEFEQAALIGEVLQWIGRTLTERSPYVSGAYKQGHKLLADGQEVAMSGKIEPAEEYTFVNMVPYARRIEIGKTKSGRSFVLQVENRIYERTAKDAKAKFGKAADIQFAYREATGAHRLAHSSGRGRGRRTGDAVSAPAIIVRLKKS